MFDAHVTARYAPYPATQRPTEACEAAANVLQVLVLVVLVVVVVVVLLDTKGGRPRPTQRMLWEWCWSCCEKKRENIVDVK